MAVVDCPIIEWPPFAFHRVTNVTSPTAMSASGHRQMSIVHITHPGIIETIRFRSGTVTSGGDVRVSIQNIDLATGLPDGTVDQFRTVNVAASNTIYETGLITSDGTDLGSKRTVSNSDIIAVVFDYASYSTQNLAVSAVTLGTATHNTYAAHYNGSAWTVQSSQLNIAISYQTDGPKFNNGAGPLSVSAATTAFNTGTSPDENAMRFRLPYKCRVAGFWVVIDGDGDFDFVLYATDGSTVLASCSLDSNVRVNTNSGTYYGLFTTPATIEANTTYYLSCKPTTATSVTLRTLQLSVAGDLASTVGGVDVYRSSRVDAGSWTDDQTQQIACGLLIDGIDVGSGGSVRIPNIRGGADQ